MRFLVLVLLSTSLAVLLAPTSALACQEDEALAEAALQLSGEPRLTADALRAALEAAGSDLIHGWARRFESDESASEWLAELDPDAPLDCGFARRTDSVTVVAAARAGRLSVDGDIARATVVASFRAPHLVIRDRHDRLHRLALEDGRASLAELEAPLMVQLVATGPRGPRPVAQRRVGPPAPPRVEGTGPLPARLDALREVRGASPLRPNRLLRQAANRHAQAICRAGVAAHRLASSDPESRLAAQGIQARVVGEAVARVAPRADPLQALVESPGHAAALVDRRFTDVGVGEARTADRRCVVVFLAAWPRFVGVR